VISCLKKPTYQLTNQPTNEKKCSWKGPRSCGANLSFADKETEAQRGAEPGPNSNLHSWLKGEPVPTPRPPPPIYLMTNSRQLEAWLEASTVHPYHRLLGLEDQVVSNHLHCYSSKNCLSFHLRIFFSNSFFNKSCQEKWLFICRKLKRDPCLSPCTSINSKWIKDLNIRPQTLKLVQERVGNTLEVIGIGKNFLNRIPAAQ
jgi:hypothetical protein